MKTSLRLIALAILVPATAVALAALYAYIRRGGTYELPNFFLWSLPLGGAVALFARRRRFSHLNPMLRAALTSLSGVVFALLLTAIGWLLIGPWMLAWDFPVLYCWAIAGALGTLAADSLHVLLLPRQAALGLAVALAPLATLWIYGSRPDPAVLIVYRDNPTFDAAQRVWDSVLTIPHPSGSGRNMRWPHISYTRTRTADGQVAALIALRRAADRDSIRTILAGNPLVRTVIDTIVLR